MTPKERTVMQQALEALESYSKSDYIKKQHPKRRANGENAITALREALGNSLKPKCFADYQPNHAIDRACASCTVAAECQTGEQAEQEPVSWIYEDELPKGYPYDEMFSRSKIIEGVRMFPKVQTEQSTVKDSLTAQEPVCVVEITYGREPECYVTGNIDDFPEGVFKLYAAPFNCKGKCCE